MPNLLTVNQVAAKIGKTAYTIKRWYNWYEQLTIEQIEEYRKQGMPELPQCAILGPTKWRYWDEADIPKLKKFSKWVPHTKRGVMNNLNNEEEK